MQQMYRPFKADFLLFPYSSDAAFCCKSRVVTIKYRTDHVDIPQCVLPLECRKPNQACFCSQRDGPVMISTVGDNTPFAAKKIEGFIQNGFIRTVAMQ